MGIACTREYERFLASIGKLSKASPEFSFQSDVKAAGVLLALPALLMNGLLKFSNKFFTLPAGYYGLESLLMVIAFASLLRIKTIEAVRYHDPGEMGKLVGLDRIPEVRTLRAKIKTMANIGDPSGWSRELAMMWMEDNPELAGTLYVDGHVRVYHGKQTKLPKRYVAREKLCLRGVTDYWVNDALGQPFFVVSQTISSGMLSSLRKDIVPRLLKEVPEQPNELELKMDRYLYRFGLVFDREGYSPAFFKEMWVNRICCYTYRKYAKIDWPEEEFKKEEVTFPNGEKSLIKLSERGVYYKKEKIWLREIRKLTESGHQTALVTTDYFNDSTQIAGYMFSRWSQENFFKYMMEHYGIDRLIDYQFENIDEPVHVVNPRYRELDSRIRSLNSKLSREKVKYADLVLDEEIEEKKIKTFVQTKTAMKEEIDKMNENIINLKEERKGVGKHISFTELPDNEKFKQKKNNSKQFLDTVKMIAYRAETSIVTVLREFMLKRDEVRSLARQIFSTDADIIPDKEKGVLKIIIHNMANPLHNRHVKKLCQILNESEVIFPGSNFRLVYDTVSNQIHGDPVF